MPLQRLNDKYSTLSQFLSESFHQDVFYEHDFADTMNELIDDIYLSFFVNQEEIEPMHVKTLREEMEMFLHDITFDSYKTRFVDECVGIDMGGLKPLEFVSYLYFRLIMDINEQKILFGEGGEAN